MLYLSGAAALVIVITGREEVVIAARGHVTCTWVRLELSEKLSGFEGKQ